MSGAPPGHNSVVSVPNGVHKAAVESHIRIDDDCGVYATIYDVLVMTDEREG